MRRAQELERHLRTLETLGEAIGAMKSLSARHFRDSREAVAPARVYREGVEAVLHGAGASLTAGPGPALLLVIGGELGLCGSYNARLVAAAVREREALGPGPIVCVGHRAATLLSRRGLEVSAAYRGPASVAGIPEFLLRLAEDVLTAFMKERRSILEVISARFEGVGRAPAVVARLLPITSTAAAPGPPVRYVTDEALRAAAVREWLYVALYDLLLSALASEHSARLMATQSAEQWLDARTAHLRRSLAAARREASTQEVLEIAGGVRARARQR